MNINGNMQTTESIESPSKVSKHIDVFDFFFVMVYVGISFAMKISVNERLRPGFMVFSFLMAVFLTSKSTINKKRRNFESIYFLITKDTGTYRPFMMKEKKI